MVSMMLPSALVELLVALEELEFEVPPRAAIELSMNDEMIDCAAVALVEDAAPDVVEEELEVLPFRAPTRP
jgi:hypothetical protein